MPTADASVPLPLVTTLPPITMDGENTSPTLPHNKPKTELTLDPPIIMNSANGNTDAEIKDTASSKYATSGNEKSVISGDTVDHPISPKTSIPPRRYQYNRKDENDFHHYINKAHTCVRQGHPVTSSDKDKDLVKLSEIVSQMTHLLAASGVGRDTTARALSYISGPDKPEPKQALIEAKRDRRKKNNARRVPSGGTDKSINVHEGDDVHSNNKGTVIDRDATTTSEDTNPPNTLDHAVTTSDKSTHARNEDTSSTVVQAKTVINDQDPFAKTGNTNGADEGKKSVGRRKWWQRRRGRGNKNKNDQDKGKENGTAQENTPGRQQDASKPDVTEDKPQADDKVRETPLGSTTNVAATAA